MAAHQHETETAVQVEDATAHLDARPDDALPFDALPDCCGCATRWSTCRSRSRSGARLACPDSGAASVDVDFAPVV